MHCLFIDDSDGSKIMNRQLFFRLFPLLVTTSLTMGAELTRQVFQGYIGAGNYSYFKLSMEGKVLLLLDSFHGDCDIYASQYKLHPTFEPDDHSLQSATCGADSIVIPSDFKRPVGIAIYGHPFHEMSHYELKVILQDSSPEDADYYSQYDSYPNEKSSYDKVNNFPPLPEPKNEEESFLWTILFGILKIIIEILTS